MFAHDHIFTNVDGQKFSNGSFPYAVLARYLCLGNTVSVVSRGRSSAQSTGLTLASGKDVEFYSVPNFRSLRGLITLLPALKIINLHVKNADAVVARLPSSVGSIAYIVARLHRRPAIVEVVGCAWDANRGHGAITGKVLAPIAYGLMRVLVGSSAYVIYITKRFLQRRYPPGLHAKTEVCPNVHLPKPSHEVLRGRLKKIDSLKGALRLGLIGSLDVAYKGHETLLRAVALLKHEKCHVSVHLAGGGDKGRWERLARELSIEPIVEFHGSIPKWDMPAWLDSIDIQVQPSSAEAQGRAILEGMSRACPVIGSNVGGVGELIDAEWLVVPGDHQGLARKILAMARNSERMKGEARKNFLGVDEYQSSNIEYRRVAFFQRFLRDMSETVKEG